MTILTDTASLAETCARLRKEPYVTIDTEFMREKTYYSILCLVQLAGRDEHVAIDPLAEGMDLTPLLELLADPNVLKVFHAARQDLEIFHHLMGTVPAPIFDTQVAAMVCGFGDSASYDSLVSRILNVQIDKSSRFTDWSNRPLSERQVDYALSDVTYLRGVYEHLNTKLEENERAPWLTEEMAILTSDSTYEVQPNEVWRRIKARNHKPRFLAVLRALAAYRELEAQRRDVPRNRVFRDEVMIDIAGLAPKSPDDLKRARGFDKSAAEGRLGREIIEAIAEGLAVPDEDCPRLPRPDNLSPGRGPIVDLLKVLLKFKSESHGVASKLIANVSDLEVIAGSDKADVAALTGWRREIFGDDALALKRGELLLGVEREKLKIQSA